MEFNKINWHECLQALNFTENRNHSLGRMQICDDKGTPQFQYETEKEQRQLFMFLSGALYMKNHLMEQIKKKY